MSNLIYSGNLKSSAAYDLLRRSQQWLTDFTSDAFSTNEAWRPSKSGPTNPPGWVVDKYRHKDEITWTLINGIADRVFGKDLFELHNLQRKTVIEAKDWALGLFVICENDPFESVYKVVAKVNDEHLAMQLKLTHF